jgi:hypothetical protein
MCWYFSFFLKETKRYLFKKAYSRNDFCETNIAQMTKVEKNIGKTIFAETLFAEKPLPNHYIIIFY